MDDKLIYSFYRKQRALEITFDFQIGTKRVYARVCLQRRFADDGRHGRQMEGTHIKLYADERKVDFVRDTLLRARGPPAPGVAGPTRLEGNLLSDNSMINPLHPAYKRGSHLCITGKEGGVTVSGTGKLFI